MDAKNHSHIFREQDVDRIIARFGNRPPSETRRKTMDSLARQKEEFIERQRSRDMLEARRSKRERRRSRGR